MKTFFVKLWEPFATIKQEPYQFIVWLFVVLIFGLAGVWLPSFFDYINDKDGMSSLLNHIRVGSIATFGVVILADGLAAMLTTVNVGLTKITAGIRGLIGTFAILLFMLNVAIFIIPYPSSKQVTTQYIAFQLSILFFTVLVAIYLYCFKSNVWEKSAETLVKNEDRQVEDMEKAADSVTADDKGVKI